jgi:hypothetical protein
MPFTPEAQEKIAAICGWFRQRLVLLIVGVMLFLQFMTWRSIVEMRRDLPGSPPRCSAYEPCSVYVIGTVTLDSNSRR